MSYTPIKLDKNRNLKYGMKAISLIEKKFDKPIMAIEGIQNGMLTMDEYATLIWAGLVHEDKDLTPEAVMDLVDEYSSLREVSKDMWKALNDVFENDEETEKDPEEQVKNEQ